MQKAFARRPAGRALPSAPAGAPAVPTAFTHASRRAAAPCGAGRTKGCSSAGRSPPHASGQPRLLPLHTSRTQRSVSPSSTREGTHAASFPQALRKTQREAAGRGGPVSAAPALRSYGYLQAGRPPAEGRGPTAGVAVRGCDATAACGCRTDTCAGALLLRPVASVLAGAAVRLLARQPRGVLGVQRSLDAMPRLTRVLWCSRRGCCGSAARPVPGRTASCAWYTLRCLTLRSMRQQATPVRWFDSAQRLPSAQHNVSKNV